jgi:hypothetical protein
MTKAVNEDNLNRTVRITEIYDVEHDIKKSYLKTPEERKEYKEASEFIEKLIDKYNERLMSLEEENKKILKRKILC